MRNLLFLSLFILVFTPIDAQKAIPRGENHLKLPMNLTEYYGDSLQVVYNAIYRLNSFAYCDEADQGKPQGFSPTQNLLLKAGTLVGSQEGGNLGYALMDPEYAAQGKEAIQLLGLKGINEVITKYEEFVAENKATIEAGEDETIYGKMWYYDSLIYDAFSSKTNVDILYNLIRNSGMFIRWDGKPFEPKTNGVVSIKNAKGILLEEVEIKDGKPSGTQRTASPTGKTLSETRTTEDYTVSKYYFTSGNISNYDSSHIKSGVSRGVSYFQSGKICSEYTSSYKYDDEGNMTSGTTREKSYYTTGKLACEIETDHMGNYKIIQAFDPKGKSSVTNGTGKVYRESADYASNGINMTMNEYKNHVQSGRSDSYYNGRMISSYMMENGISIGTSRVFHWKNGKVISETTYDAQGNYVSEKNLFDQNAPKIDAKNIRVTVEVEPETNCNTYGVWNPKFVMPTLKNEKETTATLMSKYNLLHYNTDDKTPQEPNTVKYLTIDIAENGEVINPFYTDKDEEILKILHFNAATYEGKPVKSRINVIITTKW